MLCKRSFESNRDHGQKAIHIILRAMFQFRCSLSILLPRHSLGITDLKLCDAVCLRYKRGLIRFRLEKWFSHNLCVCGMCIVHLPWPTIYGLDTNFLSRCSFRFVRTSHSEHKPGEKLPKACKKWCRIGPGAKRWLESGGERKKGGTKSKEEWAKVKHKHFDDNNRKRNASIPNSSRCKALHRLWYSPLSSCPAFSFWFALWVPLR